MGSAALETFLLDLRYTFRAMRRDAAFTAFAVLVIGLGIGASTTVFSVLNAVLVRPLPFRDPGRLVWISNHDSSGLSGQTTQVGHLRRQATASSSKLARIVGLGARPKAARSSPSR